MPVHLASATPSTLNHLATLMLVHLAFLMLLKVPILVLLDLTSSWVALANQIALTATPLEASKYVMAEKQTDLIQTPR